MPVSIPLKLEKSHLDSPGLKASGLPALALGPSLGLSPEVTQPAGELPRRQLLHSEILFLSKEAATALATLHLYGG